MTKRTERAGSADGAGGVFPAAWRAASANLAIGRVSVSCTVVMFPIVAWPTLAPAQTSYVGPDRLSRYPGVTIFCPNGNSVVPCNFAGSGTMALSTGGVAVSAANPLAVRDGVLDGLITGAFLPIGGTVSLSGALPAGGNALGSVSVSNFPVTQMVGGTLAVGNFPSVQPVSGTLSIGNWPALQPVSGSVAISTLPALAAGTSTIGTVQVGNLPAVQPVSGTLSVGNFPAIQPISAAALPLPANAATDSSLSAPYGPVTPATATATRSVLVGCQAATSLPSFTAGQQGAVPCDTSGRLYVVTVPSANNVPGYLQAVSSGGAVTYSAANTAGACLSASVKASAGMVYGYSVSNSNSSGVWLRFYSSATAVSCGTGTPVKRVYVPPTSTVGLASDLGWVLGSGIAYTATAGSGADTDSTAITAANSVLVNIDYK